MGLDGQSVNQLATQAKRPANRLRAQHGQESIVVSGPPPETESKLVESQAGNECPVDHLRRNLGQAGPRLRDTQGAREEILGRVSDSIKLQPPRWLINAREMNVFL